MSSLLKQESYSLLATSQPLATWEIVSGIKWPKQPILMEMRLTDKSES